MNPDSSAKELKKAVEAKSLPADRLAVACVTLSSCHKVTTNFQSDKMTSEEFLKFARTKIKEIDVASTLRPKASELSPDVVSSLNIFRCREAAHQTLHSLFTEF